MFLAWRRVERNARRVAVNHGFDHREVDMLTKIERRKERQKLRGESVCRIIEMNVKVTGDNKVMGSGCNRGEKRTEVIKENREWFGISGRKWRTIDIED